MPINLTAITAHRIGVLPEVNVLDDLIRSKRVIPLCGSLPFYGKVFGLRAATLATGGGS